MNELYGCIIVDNLLLKGRRVFCTVCLTLLSWWSVHAQPQDSLDRNKSIIHRFEADFSPGFILHTNPYLRGGNSKYRTMNHDMGYKLSYSFEKTISDTVALAYPKSYQGIGMVRHQYNSMLGNPLSAYIFQGAPIAELGRYVSLNYEWNLGLAFGWNHYDQKTNPQNRVIGSKVTAYINADLYVSIRLSSHLDMNVGGGFSHFSNGNTTIPNNGLNTLNARLGLAYYLNRLPREMEPMAHHSVNNSPMSHPYCYDLMLFGAWRRRGIDVYGGSYALPNKYLVTGFNATALRRLTSHFQVGISLDGVLDRSANVDVDISQIPPPEIPLDPSDIPTIQPSLAKQVALGMSSRAEWVMPYFTIDLGMGHFVLNAKRDFNCWYQVLALKVALPRQLFLHVGYSLHDFKTPNHLMLGLGYRFGG